jgi:nucleotide-binding universal stress UspA family protein
MLTQDIDQVAAPALAGEGSIRRVLVAFDGSEGAWAALRRGIAIALDNRARLTVAAVVPPAPPFACGVPGALVTPYSSVSLQRDVEIEMEQALAAARDEIPAAISVTTRLLHGRASRALGRLAEDGGFDLVVTGPRPMSRLRRLLHRSVTQRLLARGHVSVLAVK